MARRTKAEAEETKEAIIEAAQRVFYTRGVTNTSLAHIAKEAGVTRGAIYWHFRNKQDLFDAMSERRQLPLEALLERVRMDNGVAALSKLRSHLVELLKNIVNDESHRQFFEVILLKCEFNQDNQTLLERQRNILHNSGQRIGYVLSMAVAAGDLPEQLDISKAASFLQAGIIGVLYSWLIAPSSYDLCDYAEPYVDTLIGGLRFSAGLHTT